MIKIRSSANCTWSRCTHAHTWTCVQKHAWRGHERARSGLSHSGLSPAGPAPGCPGPAGGVLPTQRRLQPTLLPLLREEGPGTCAPLSPTAAPEPDETEPSLAEGKPQTFHLQKRNKAARSPAGPLNLRVLPKPLFSSLPENTSFSHKINITSNPLPSKGLLRRPLDNCISI